MSFTPKMKTEFCIRQGKYLSPSVLTGFFITLYSLLLSLLFLYFGELQKDDGDDGEKLEMLKKYLMHLDDKLKERLLRDTLLK